MVSLAIGLLHLSGGDAGGGAGGDDGDDAGGNVGDDAGGNDPIINPIMKARSQRTVGKVFKLHTDSAFPRPR